VQVEDTIRLNANEAPWTGPGDPFSRPLNRYPEIRPSRLRATLAGRFGCRPEQLLVTRGSSEAIDLLVRTFCRAGQDRIVIAEPTFSMYAHYAAVQGADVVGLPTDPDRDFAIDADAIDTACDDSVRLVFLCTPNNPTGTTIERASIVDLLQRLAGRAAVVVDEAYIEFAGAGSVATLLPEHDNLLVLRTLSKALACAGARCGAVMGAAEIISMLDAVQAPYAVATPVVECVENALAGNWLGDAEAHAREIVAERGRMAESLAAHPAIERVWPSAANFLLVRCNDVDAVREAAQQAGILLRYLSDPLADCVRITIGSPEENERLLQALEGLRASDGERDG
jgi:histidinol-phosphate aminotransferase